MYQFSYFLNSHSFEERHSTRAFRHFRVIIVWFCRNGIPDFADLLNTEIAEQTAQFRCRLIGWQRRSLRFSKQQVDYGKQLFGVSMIFGNNWLIVVSLILVNKIIHHIPCLHINLSVDNEACFPPKSFRLSARLLCLSDWLVVPLSFRSYCNYPGLGRC